MVRMMGIIQLLISAVLVSMGVAMIFNMISIAMEAESGTLGAGFYSQFIVLLFVALWSRILFVKGSERLKMKD